MTNLNILGMFLDTLGLFLVTLPFALVTILSISELGVIETIKIWATTIGIILCITVGIALL